MTREPVPINIGQGGNGAVGRADPPRGPYWDLDLLTPDDVCALLKVKKSSLYDVVENGALEAIRLGKQLRFRPSALIRYLEERTGNGNERADDPRHSTAGALHAEGESRYQR